MTYRRVLMISTQVEYDKDTQTATYKLVQDGGVLCTVKVVVSPEHAHSISRLLDTTITVSQLAAF